MSASWTKSNKNNENKEIGKMADDASKFLGGILGDINSKSAYTQIGIGAVSGWVSGFATMKIGKFAAFAIGGTIILVEIAHHEGLISIDWSKVNKKLDKVSDKVETAVTGQSPSWMDKAERFVDRKIDRIDRKSRKWYSKLIGDENGARVNDLHIFLTAFIGGAVVGVACA